MNRDLQMFGIERKKFLESVTESLTFQYDGVGSVVMSMLSDAQEEINGGLLNEARMTLNRAKFLLAEFNLDKQVRELKAQIEEYGHANAAQLDAMRGKQ